MDTYYFITFFIFGLFFGSFFNVVAYRLPLRMSLIKPGSHCPKCNHRLGALELIPVFSWLIQGGKCKKCNKPIPAFYPIFEITTGILFAFIYKIYGLSLDTLVMLLFVSAILISILSDTLYMIVINSVLVFCEIIIFAIKFYQGGFDVIMPLIIDMSVSYAFICFVKFLGGAIFQKEAMGDGDLCLFILFGLVLGYEMSVVILVIASFLALIPALISLRRTENHELPFGPFLGMAALICVYFQIDVTMVLEFLGF